MNIDSAQNSDVLKRECVANDIISKHILSYHHDNGPLEILEAGCGTKWGLNIEEIDYTLTGVDISPEAIAARKDLDKVIVADLRTVSLKDNKYDIIYCADVLEHIDGAESVLDNFFKWLKPGGLLILKIPDGDSVFGYLARITPFWFHVFYYRIQGCKNAGKPGCSPFKTYYETVVSRKGVHDYCRKHGLVIQAEYGTVFSYATRAKTQLFYLFVTALLKITHLLSFGRLAIAHTGLIYVIAKP